MASPLATAKQPVSLGSPGARRANGAPGSRIRRDPPPVAKPVALVDPERRDTRTVVIGILTFTLALLIIGVGLSNAVGWSPRNYTAHF